MGLKPDVLKPIVEDYKAQTKKAGKPDPEIVVMSGLPLKDLDRCREILESYQDAGATTVIHGQKYDKAIELQDAIGQLALII